MALQGNRPCLLNIDEGTDAGPAEISEIESGHHDSADAQPDGDPNEDPFGEKSGTSGTERE